MGRDGDSSLKPNFSPSGPALQAHARALRQTRLATVLVRLLEAPTSFGTAFTVAHGAHPAAEIRRHGIPEMDGLRRLGQLVLRSDPLGMRVHVRCFPRCGFVANTAQALCWNRVKERHRRTTGREMPGTASKGHKGLAKDHQRTTREGSHTTCTEGLGGRPIASTDGLFSFGVEFIEHGLGCDILLNFLDVRCVPETHVQAGCDSKDHGR